MGNELYIGAPNGIVLCVDGIDQMGCSGRFYHAYQEEAVLFRSLGEMLFRMEAFFDDLNFPRRGNSQRTFIEHGGAAGAAHIQQKEKIMSGLYAMTYGSVYLDGQYLSSPTTHNYTMREEDFPAIEAEMKKNHQGKPPVQGLHAAAGRGRPADAGARRGL